MTQPARQERAVGALAYRVHDVARMLDVSDRTIWRMIRANTLHASRIGRSRRIPASEVHRLLGQEQAPTQPVTSAAVLDLARQMIARGTR